MVVLGLLLIALGVAAILAGIFTAELGTGGQVQLVGLDVTPRTLFLVGVVAGVLVLWGYTVLKYGTKRGLRQRRDRKRLSKLSAEAERRDDRPRNEGPLTGGTGSGGTGHDGPRNDPTPP